MKSTKLTFTGAMGEKLSAKFDTPDDGNYSHVALFAHCFTCSKNLKTVGNITRVLAEKGIATFRFDFTGLGESEGDFADTNFSSNVDDLVAAYQYCCETYKSPEILIGHSLGGAAVLQAAHQMPEVKAVTTMGAPADPEHVKKNFGLQLSEIESEGEAEVTLAGRSFTIKKQFLDDLEDASMKEYTRGLKRALLVMHSPLDETVGIENAERIFIRARHPKSFVSLDQSNHLMTDDSDSRYAGSVVVTWASIYI